MSVKIKRNLEFLKKGELEDGRSTDIELKRNRQNNADITNRRREDISIRSSQSFRTKPKTDLPDIEKGKIRRDKRNNP